jgi:putative peptidoglycan lipid II flippase
MLALPASIGLIILREPIISLLYQRGEFDERSVQLVAWAVLWYAAGLVGHSIMEILTRAFYAQHDTFTPVLIGTVAMGLNVIFSIAFSGLFAGIGWMPLGGLALANSLATALEATTLFIVIRRKLQGIEGGYLLKGAGVFGLSGLAMAVSLLYWTRLMGSTHHLLIALGGVPIGGLIYFLLVWLMRAPEIKLLTGAVSNRLRR